MKDLIMPIVFVGMFIAAVLSFTVFASSVNETATSNKLDGARATYIAAPTQL